MVPSQWYREHSVFAKCPKKYKVTYDSTQENGFVVHKTDGTNHVFMPSNKGLFYSDVKSDVI